MMTIIDHLKIRTDKTMIHKGLQGLHLLRLDHQTDQIHQIQPLHHNQYHHPLQNQQLRKMLQIQLKQLRQQIQQPIVPQIPIQIKQNQNQKLDIITL